MNRAVVAVVLLLTSCGLPNDPPHDGRIVPAPAGYVRFCADHPGDRLCQPS